MGYRFDNKPPKPEDHLRKFAVRNGATLNLAFGCYYLYKHDTKYHDHVGWPNPDNYDKICQLDSNMKLYPIKNKDATFDPIHLREEGYDQALIAFEDSTQAQYITATAAIGEDNIVRLEAKTNFPTFSDKPKDLRFTLFVSKPNNAKVDAICHGVISILPGPSCPGNTSVTQPESESSSETSEPSEPINLSTEGYSIVSIDTQSYSGGSVTPAVIVKSSSNETLTSGTDYIYTYLNNINTGTAYVVVAGVGNYTGIISTTFTIASTVEPQTDGATPFDPNADNDNLVYHGSDNDGDN